MPRGLQLFLDRAEQFGRVLGTQAMACGQIVAVLSRQGSELTRGTPLKKIERFAPTNILFQRGSSRVRKEVVLCES